MPKTPIKRYFGLNVIGKTKKSKKVIGLSGRFKQKKDKNDYKRHTEAQSRRRTEAQCRNC